MEEKEKVVIRKFLDIRTRLDMLEFYSVNNENELIKLVNEAKRLSQYLPDKDMREKCSYEFGQTYINRVLDLERAKKINKSRAYGKLILNFRGAFLPVLEIKFLSCYN